MKKITTPLWFLIFLIISFRGYSQCGTVTDIDGNVYNTVTIGSQCWMKENLKTTHFLDGSPITEVEDGPTWVSTNNPAWCYYNGNAANNGTYGKLYNKRAATDTNQVCPVGWHVPSDLDFQKLSTHLGGWAVSGGHMKSTSGLWLAPNLGADNSSGFTALPAGYRDGYFESFYNLGSNAVFVSSSLSTYVLINNESDLSTGSGGLSLYRGGYSVRCVSNSSPSGLPNIDDKPNEGIQIFPNPATNQLTINLGGLQAEHVSIYNVDGKLVSETKQPANNRIDISNLAMGVYVAEVKVRDAVQRVRWVKM